MKTASWHMKPTAHKHQFQPFLSGRDNGMGHKAKGFFSCKVHIRADETTDKISTPNTSKTESNGLDYTRKIIFLKEEMYVGQWSKIDQLRKTNVRLKGN